MSSESRGLYSMMETIGGAFLDDIDDEPLERISAAKALEALEKSDDASTSPVFATAYSTNPLARRAGCPRTFTERDLPEPLRRAEAHASRDRFWQKLGVGVAATEIAVSDKGERAHLLWAKGGTGIATHRHVGREVVLVLKGAFWDDGICYGPGDVAVSEDGSIHAPRIDDSEDCLCFAVTEAPVHFTGLPGIILNRFCRF
jgi:putative transcriptional regulator